MDAQITAALIAAGSAIVVKLLDKPEERAPGARHSRRGLAATVLVVIAAVLLISAAPVRSGLVALLSDPTWAPPAPSSSAPQSSASQTSVPAPEDGREAAQQRAQALLDRYWAENVRLDGRGLADADFVDEFFYFPLAWYKHDGVQEPLYEKPSQLTEPKRKHYEELDAGGGKDPCEHDAAVVRSVESYSDLQIVVEADVTGSCPTVIVEYTLVATPDGSHEFAIARVWEPYS